MITDIERKYLQDLLDGKIKKKDNPRKYSAYIKRMGKRIDKMTENLLWLAENRPDLLKDLEAELLDENLKTNRRARALIKAVSLFENEPTVFSLIAEVYNERVVSLEKKKHVDNPA